MDSFRESVISSVRGEPPHLPKGQLLAIDLWYDQLARSTTQSVSKQQQCNKGEDFRYLYITTQITHIYRHMWKQRWELVGSTDFGRASLSSSHRHGNLPPALVTAVMANKNKPEVDVSLGPCTRISYPSAQRSCNNKRDLVTVTASVPPRGARTLVFMSAWVRLGVCAIRSECMRVDCCSRRST